MIGIILLVVGSTNRDSLNSDLMLFGRGCSHFGRTKASCSLSLARNRLVFINDPFLILIQMVVSVGEIGYRVLTKKVISIPARLSFKTSKKWSILLGFRMGALSQDQTWNCLHFCGTFLILLQCR